MISHNNPNIYLKTKTHHLKITPPKMSMETEIKKLNRWSCPPV